MGEPARFRNPETAAETVRRLETEAKQIARSATDALLVDLNLIAGRCAELGGLQSLPPGLRDLLPRLGQQIADTLEQARAIEARAA